MYSNYAVEIAKLYLTNNPNNLSVEEFVKMFDGLVNQITELIED